MPSSTISGNVTLSQTLVNGYTWPVNVSGGTASSPIVVTFGPGIVLTASNDTFVVQNNTYVVFEGSNNTVDISGVTGYCGLVFNFYTNTSSVTVQNLGVTNIAGNSTLTGVVPFDPSGNASGWIVSGGTSANAINCYSTGIIGNSASTVLGAGGIFGKRCKNSNATNCYSTGTAYRQVGGIFGSQSNTCSAANCYSTGIISGLYAGSIFGYGSNICTATSCYSTGIISGQYTSGIFGYGSNTCSATSCYSTGIISGQYASGIFGYGSNTCIATSCYSTGIISGQYASGIFGYGSNISTATSCNSTGAITGLNSGGIFGEASTNCTATFCYSIGEISGQNTGGIFGTNVDKCDAINCYSTGEIRGLSSGGIFGYSQQCIQNAIDCYSTGNINASYGSTVTNQCGGIFGFVQNSGGSTGHSGFYTATNCYSLGNITYGNNGGIFAGGNNGYPLLNAINCYSYGSSGVYQSAGTVIVNGFNNTNIVNGIFGYTNTNEYSYAQSNCYIANQNWRDASANVLLLRPQSDLSDNSGVSIGLFWTSIAPNTPFFLSSFNQSPYNPSAAASYVGNTFTSLPASTNYNQIRIIQNVGPAGSVTIDPSFNRLVFSGLTTVGVDTVSVFARNAVGGYSSSKYFLVIQGGCFLEGTMIKVLLHDQEYYVPIETLKPGDVVLTQNKGARKIKYIGFYECGNGLFKLSKTDYPALFTDLVVTGGHPILVDALTEVEKAETLKIWPELRKNGDNYRLLTMVNSKALPYLGDETTKVWDFVLENNDIHENFAIFANGQLTECMEEDYFLNSSGLKQP